MWANYYDASFPALNEFAPTNLDLMNWHLRADDPSL